MKIDIIYRACAKETGGLPIPDLRPSWFSKELCFLSLLNMIKQMPEVTSIPIVWDGKPSLFLDYIKSTLRNGTVTMVNENSSGSIDHQWAIADKLNGDFIYFIEDDYLHTKDAAKIFLEGAKRFGLFTLYDHPDRYSREDDISRRAESIEVTKSCHWRSSESTTSTFACSRKMWNQIREAAVKHRFYDRDFFRHLISIGIRLWTPTPAQSTHCLTPYLSPFIDWEKVAKEVAL